MILVILVSGVTTNSLPDSHYGILITVINPLNIIAFFINFLLVNLNQK